MVGKDVGIGPDQAQAAVLQVVAQRPVAEQVVGWQRRWWRRGGRAGHRVEAPAQLGGRGVRCDDGLQRVDRRAVPVAVEERLQWRHHEADDESVDVDEVLCRTAQEILVGDVAPAEHGHRAIGDEQFVVHAVVDALPVTHRGDEARHLAAVALHDEGVEDAHLDVGVRCKGLQQSVLPGGVVVVDQQPHAHAALRGVTQRTQQPAAGVVVLEVVVLQVQRHLRAPRQLHPRVQRIAAQWHQAQPGMQRVGPVGAGHAAQRRLHGQRNGFAGGGLTVDRRQAGAGRQRAGQQWQQQGLPRPGRQPTRVGAHAHVWRQSPGSAVVLRRQAGGQRPTAPAS